MLELTPEGGKCWLTRKKSFGYVCQLALNVENIKFELTLKEVKEWMGIKLETQIISY